MLVLLMPCGTVVELDDGETLNTHLYSEEYKFLPDSEAGKRHPVGSLLLYCCMMTSCGTADRGTICAVVSKAEAVYASHILSLFLLC